jgi:hypothetical protein
MYFVVKKKMLYSVIRAVFDSVLVSALSQCFIGKAPNMYVAGVWFACLRAPK